MNYLEEVRELLAVDLPADDVVLLASTLEGLGLDSFDVVDLELDLDIAGWEVDVELGMTVSALVAAMEDCDAEA